MPIYYTRVFDFTNALESQVHSLSFKDLPESRGVLITLLLVTMGHTVIQEGIALNRSDEAVTAAYTIFGLSCVLLAVILITHLVVMTLLVYRFECCRINIIFSFILQSLGAVLYFLGDNLSKLVNRYNKSLKIAKIAGTVCIAVALVFFLFVPQISHLLFDAKKICFKTKKPIPKTKIILVEPADDEKLICNHMNKLQKTCETTLAVVICSQPSTKSRTKIEKLKYLFRSLHTFSDAVVIAMTAE